MKIYIIGPTGSGKTTLSKILSKKYNIEVFELDLLVFDDENGHIRRTDEEINKRFKKIINNKNWIIEDIGRTKFREGIKKADKIYYLKIKKITVYLRVIKRWIKQKLGKESYNYPPTILQLLDMLKITREYYIKEKNKLESLNEFKDKVIYLNKKDLNEMEKIME